MDARRPLWMAAAMTVLAACPPAQAPVEAAPAPAPEPSAEDVRRGLVEREVAAAEVATIRTDLRDAPAADREAVRHLLTAGAGIERLFMLQKGTWRFRDQVAGDAASGTLFARNQGPWCEAPATRDEAGCNAVPSLPPRRSGLYPDDLQTDGFCDALDPALMTPFTAVRRQDEALVAVPYTEVWHDEMDAVAAELRAAADALDPEAEAAFRAYLVAAADAFQTNDWFAADAAWAEMSPENSAWYLRIGPDETYFDPCGVHAGFHLLFARVNPAGQDLQALLTPVRQDLEAAVAALAGPPYEERTVGFDVPEFIDVVVNAGDDRAPYGAVTGQSLPNWGPVADSGGRTVAMTNIGNDPAMMTFTGQALSSLMCPATYARWPSQPDAQITSTVMHEVAHNLGPSYEYAVDGKKDVEIFGGPRSLMLEELKAQTLALWMNGWLAEHGLTAPDRLSRLHMGDIGWAVGQTAMGMYDAEGGPSAYPQLAAIQLGAMLDAGAVSWDPEAPAADGTTGCLSVDLAAVPDAVDTLTTEILRIKATGDRAAAEALEVAHVEGRAELWETVQERWSKVPLLSYTYDVTLE